VGARRSVLHSVRANVTARHYSRCDTAKHSNNEFERMKFDSAASLPLLFVDVVVREQMSERVRSADHKVQRIASPLVCRPAVCCESDGRLWPRQARRQGGRQAGSNLCPALEIRCCNDDESAVSTQSPFIALAVLFQVSALRACKKGAACAHDQSHRRQRAAGGLGHCICASEMRQPRETLKPVT